MVRTMQLLESRSLLVTCFENSGLSVEGWEQSKIDRNHINVEFLPPLRVAWDISGILTKRLNQYPPPGMCLISFASDVEV